MNAPAFALVATTHSLVPSCPVPGDEIGDGIVLGEVLGAGGMGRVFAARDRAGRSVAVKVLAASHAAPPKRVTMSVAKATTVERFLRESDIAARIGSKHVVAVHGTSTADDPTPFIVLQRLTGSDLSRRVAREGVLPARDVADAVIFACDALAHAHAAGIVHRDVKPANLVEHAADGRRSVVLVDFGVAKVLGDDDGKRCARVRRSHRPLAHLDLTTSRDGLLGTPAYMSPEHARNARRLDHRTDLYALGAVAYQLLTGKLPFDGRSLGEMLMAILNGRFAPLHELRGDLPAGLEAIVVRCLARDPDERFDKAADLARALAPFASPEVALLVDAMPRAVAVPRLQRDEPSVPPPVRVLRPLTQAGAWGPLCPHQSDSPHEPRARDGAG